MNEIVSMMERIIDFITNIGREIQEINDEESFIDLNEELDSIIYQHEEHNNYQMHLSGNY